MAPRAVTQTRIDWAYQELLKHRALHRIVADLSEREGISRRQARRIAAAAYKQFCEALDDVDRTQMVARAIYALETVVDRSLVTGNLNAAIGATRTLVEMLNLSIKSPIGTLQTPRHTGRRGGYG